MGDESARGAQSARTAEAAASESVEDVAGRVLRASSRSRAERSLQRVGKPATKSDVCRAVGGKGAFDAGEEEATPFGEILLPPKPFGVNVCATASRTRASLADRLRGNKNVPKRGSVPDATK